MARSEGKPIEPEVPAVPIHPPIVPAAEIKKAAKKKKARHRKRTNYTPALGKAICKMLGRGMTLTSLCKRPMMPREDTVLGWAIDPDHPFARQYARAREVGYIRMADQIIDIADDSVNDFMEREIVKGVMGVALNREAIERTRIRLDTRKWLLSKALPKIYGDKIIQEHSGKDGGPIQTQEAPQATGADHLSDLTKRYATGLTVIAGGKKAAGSAH